MKHLIRWMKINAFINLYLGIILTMVLIALVVDITLDSYWHTNDFKELLLGKDVASTD
jgi:hypothetical protein